ncbi:DgyrCDS8102 [Dimorphilus gyrociliatus]|uniref:Kinesin-like protein 6 n=1 Tax=Dimorphilus gyrociliatus TaxID=2664684 RepID=A0A7I8VUW4_9ANNE|nr:DgyrCDS8102 [Dimorphilus gyrociliatus]
MRGPTTILTHNPEDSSDEPREFVFDYSYWSHDGCKEEGNGYYSPDKSHPNGKKFCDQRTVYDDLGKGVLANAWKGYNSTLFAYGQTGSGKSWSVVGYGENKGIIPLFCNDVFKEIEEKRKAADGTSYEVSFNMLEIYNEKVRDLLNPKKSNLKVRQHPKKGFYAEGLMTYPVDNYEEIESKMEEGTLNRTVASTNMNATSSRAHTIVGITFVQKFKNAAGEETAKTAVCNLVDLAGSERAESTGATGDRLKEGAAINQSLSSLGNCIAALADRSSGKKVRIPYRDSVLTKLLKNALGGNSKTIMIAAISPADINYDETLSTLRYADRAKQIKNVATVNEDPTEKMIRELQEENERLKEMLKSGKISVPVADEDDMDENMTADEKAALKKEMEEDYAAQLDENAREMEEMKKAFEEKLKAAREAGSTKNNEMNEKKKALKNTPHLYNLNFDPQLTGHIFHLLNNDETIIGKDESSNIRLNGPSILNKHAIIRKTKGKFTIEKASSESKILVNGQVINETEELEGYDRIMFGTTQLFVYANPSDKKIDVTFEMAQQEIARNSGLSMNDGDDDRPLSKDELILNEDMAEIVPAIEEANSISEELNKKRKFELLLVSAEARGENEGRTKIFVKMKNLENNLEWVWPKEKFMNRKYVMQELFEKYQDGESFEVDKSRDPFAEDEDAEVHVGSVKVWTQSLSYVLDAKEQLEILDFKGNEIGKINIELLPCNKKGKVLTDKDDIWVDKPEDLIGKDLHFIFKILSARGLPSRFKEFYCKYQMYGETEWTNTKTISKTTNPDWNFDKTYHYENISEKLLEQLKSNAIMLQLWGVQKIVQQRNITNTKSALLKEASNQGRSLNVENGSKKVDINKVKYSMELAVMKKRATKAEIKIAQWRRLVIMAEEQNKSKVSTKIIKELFHSHTSDEAEKCYKLLAKEKDDDNEQGGKSSTCVLL